MNSFLIIAFIFILGVVIWALFSKEKAPGTDLKGEMPEKLYRRRASDKEIEEKFPDKKEKRFRRKTDVESDAGETDEDEDFNLPYIADEIISETSRFRVFRRTLLNSEIYARKGDFTTAISLYQGVNDRINDENVNLKINENIKYLEEFKGKVSAKKREAGKKQRAGDKSSEVKFSLDGPFKIPDKIQISLGQPSDSGINAERIAHEVAEKILSQTKGEALEREKKFEKYQSEINFLKGKLEEIYKSGKEGSYENKEAVEYGSEIDELKSKLDNLVKSKDGTAVIKGESEIRQKELDDQLLKFREGIEKIYDRVESLSREDERTKHDLDRLKSEMERHIPETESEPGLTEAKFQSKDIRGSQPVIEPPAPQPVKFQQGQKDSEIRIDQGRMGAGGDEGPEEIEVLGQEKKEDELDGLSDEDIFEKILSDNVKKKDESFEIMGYKQDDKKRDSYYNLDDKEREEKEREEAKFYRKFLKHGKRVRKELPVLKVSYDFSKLPDEFSISRDQNILQYSFFKYKPMLEKANEFIKRKDVRDAINYYNVIKDQNIPLEFKAMLNQNINELTEYIEKYLSAD